jgi:uncharacterized membrane protein HdeD (DUF308 family)
MPEERAMEALVRNWWMIVVRGALAAAFGLSLLLPHNVTLPLIVVLFGVYAIVDGLWAIAAGLRASRPRFAAWPVVLEGAVSIVLGLIALGRPFVSREFLYVLVGWGLFTGVLEVIGAVRLPREAAGHWFLAMGGGSSLFLALLVFSLPHASLGIVAAVLGAFAIVFGLTMLLAAVRFHCDWGAVGRAARPA